MNSYDATHLRLLGLIEAQREDDLASADAYELNVLIVCKYVVIEKGSRRFFLSPEGHHYYQRLSDLALRYATLSGCGSETTYAVAMNP